MRGQLCLICAGPGTGKSAFVLTYALRAKIPSLYFSADSDAFTQLTRSLSIMEGLEMSEAAAVVRSGVLGPHQATLSGIPIRFDYSASPDLDRISNLMASYDEVYGDYPALVIVDNVSNVRAGGLNDEDPFAGLEVTMEFLHDMARKTGSCVVGMHHPTGPFNDADKPIPLSGVKGQIGRIPELILTMHRVPSQYGTDVLNISTVKNRGGVQDPSGKCFVSLDFDGATMQIKDQT